MAGGLQCISGLFCDGFTEASTAAGGRRGLCEADPGVALVVGDEDVADRDAADEGPATFVDVEAQAPCALVGDVAEEVLPGVQVHVGARAWDGAGEEELAHGEEVGQVLVGLCGVAPVGGGWQRRTDKRVRE